MKCFDHTWKGENGCGLVAVKTRHPANRSRNRLRKTVWQFLGQEQTEPSANLLKLRLHAQKLLVSATADNRLS